MKKQSIFLLFILCCLSCASQKAEVIAKSTIKLEGKNTNIRDLLDIDGVYSSSTMFFQDGTWVIFSMKKNTEEKINNLFNYVETWSEKKQVRWGTYWGVYEMKNDTIIVHYYDKGTLLKGWSLNQRKYKVIDRRTIQIIYDRSILEQSEEYYKTNTPWLNLKPVHFILADSLPSSDNWLKENKWIWRNESDWKEYMQHVEQVKKQYKKK